MTETATLTHMAHIEDLINATEWVRCPDCGVYRRAFFVRVQPCRCGYEHTGGGEAKRIRSIGPALMTHEHQHASFSPREDIGGL